MIPQDVLDGLGAQPVSRQLREAASELAFRMARGEYAPLDEPERQDLASLAEMLGYWAERVAALEAAAQMPEARQRPQAPNH